eukprot:4500096-Alexandrium_andersonii.AAC.1
MAVSLPPGFLDFFESSIQEARRVPSRSTVYRHRFTLCAAWCLSTRSQTDALLRQAISDNRPFA